MKTQYLPRQQNTWRTAIIPALLRGSWCALLLALAVTQLEGQPANGNTPSTAVFTNYHGWNDSVSVNNGVVEAIIVPADGRVQQFRFLGDTNGAFWEDSRLYGRTPSGFYRSFGGDKAWPSPSRASPPCSCLNQLRRRKLFWG